MNLKDLAQELGLSVTTVSRALNGFPEVSSQTRALVQAAAERHQYRPNASARRLALGRTDAVGLVLPGPARGLDDAGLFEVIAATGGALAERGVDLLLLLATEQAPLAAYERALAARRVDAFVVVRTQLRDARLAMLSQRAVPFVAYGRSATLREPYAWLDFDHEAGAAQAARRLLAQGHGRVAYIGAAPRYDFAARRFDAFARTLAGQGGALFDGGVLRTATDAHAGHAAMRQLLALPRPPGAVFVDNSMAGAGALQALLDAGLQPGRDIALLVYGGVGEGVAGGAKVTAVMQPEPELTGQRLAEMVLALLGGHTVASLQCLRAPLLRLRSSDGPRLAPR